MRLMIAPHIDDDVLGCASVLGPDTLVVYCAVDESHIPGRLSRREREKEAIAAGKVASSPPFLMLDQEVEGYIFPVNQLRIGQCIEGIESVLNEVHPTEVYVPWPSYNQDHQAVFRAAQVALRPHDVNWFVPRVFAYEQIHVAQWDVYPDRRFQPAYYRPLDIDKKLAMYAAMASQVRSFRSPDMIRAHAALRGAACGMPYAEAFEVLRWVEGS